jgi:DNA-binding response OmpR family regulator
VSAEEILVIEDDGDISELVQYNLERHGYKVHAASDGEMGFQAALRLQPALILLDIMLPGVDGLTLCRRLRENNDTRHVPIIMLTAKGEESDVVVGLELGADDYVTKPFSPKELIARVKALLRRSELGETPVRAGATGRLAVGPIEFDEERHEVFHRGQPVAFTLAEFRLLQTLISKPGRVFTRDQLLEKITGGDTYVIDRNVDVHVRAIRKKLDADADFIVTVRGVGYKCRD